MRHKPANEQIADELALFVDDVAARRCCFCGCSLAEQDGYDIIYCDDGEVVCVECFHKHRGPERAWGKFYKMTGAAPWRVQ
jgi:hypothetical protein